MNFLLWSKIRISQDLHSGSRVRWPSSPQAKPKFRLAEEIQLQRHQSALMSGLIKLEAKRAQVKKKAGSMQPAVIDQGKNMCLSESRLSINLMNRKPLHSQVFEVGEVVD